MVVISILNIGTGVRDYIHVTDLVLGHIAVIEKLKNGYHYYNLGSEKFYSVLKMVHTFERVNKIRIPYKITNRKLGDLDETFCNLKKAER